MYNKHTVIAIIPALNEEGKIGTTVSKMPGIVDEILVIDDGSRDNTVKEAESRGATILSHKTNRGVGAAIRTGIEYALNKKYDICVVMGGDNQDNPKQIPVLLDPIIDEGYDFVQGSRYLYGIKQIPKFRRVTTKFYILLFKIVCGYPLTDGSNGFRAFRTKIAKNFNLWQKSLDRYELEPYFMLKAIKKGYKFKEAPVQKFYRDEGYTKMVPVRDWYSILKPLLKELFRLNK